MVYTSVPDYTSARWAEMAGIDVAVVGDSLAMVAHGHPNTIPATMDMMVLHAAAVRRGAPNTFVLGCMPYQSYNTVDRALANATRFMQEAACDAIKPQGGKSQAHILKAPVHAPSPTAPHTATPHPPRAWPVRLRSPACRPRVTAVPAYGSFPITRRRSRP